MNTSAMTPEIQRRLSIEVGFYFHPSTPIGEKDLFAGRLKQIHLVFDAIFQKGMHAIIYGERGVGKTSLANVLKGLLPPEQGQLSSLRVQCNSEDTFESIWYRIFNTMQLTKGEKRVGFAPDIRTAGVDTGHFFNKEDFFSPDAVRNALLMVESIYQIIIIDEFDRPDDKCKKMFSDLIKNLSDYSVPSTIILIGVGESVTDLIKEHASVSRALKQIQMPRMNTSEVEDILNKGTQKMGMTIEPAALTQITLMSQGLPYYAHLLGLHATRSAISDSSFSVEMNHVKAAITAAIEDSQESIMTNYKEAIFSARKDNIFSDVLLAAALAAKNSDFGEFTAQDVCIPLSKIRGKKYDIPSFAKHLNDFSKGRGKILTKLGESRKYRYKFTDPLMQPYVIMNGLVDLKIMSADLQYSV